MCDCHHKSVLADALEVLDLENGDVVDWVAAHEGYCGKHYGRCCDCQPRVCFTTISGEYVVDECGTLTARYLN